MGIDIFLEWEGCENRPEDDKIDVFSTVAGHLGYLREAYNGGPYATQILVREAFESSTCRAKISAAKMRARLTKKSRAARGCNGGHALSMFMTQAVKDKKIADPAEFEKVLMQQMRQGIAVPDVVTPSMSVEDAVTTRYAALYPEETSEHVQDVIQSFRDFVELAERREKETGKPCVVYASY